MSLLGGIFSGVKALLGVSGGKGADNVMKVATGIGKWIDNNKFTDQEKATYRAKMLVHYSAYMESTVGENSERSRTRREIAMWIIRTEIGLLVISGLLYKFDAGWAEYIYKICTDSPLGLLTLGVGAFFFGTHLVRAAKG